MWEKSSRIACSGAKNREMDTVEGQTPSETEEEAALGQEEPEVMAPTGEKVRE
jgi:hypothetical protein